MPGHREGESNPLLPCGSTSLISPEIRDVGSSDPRGKLKHNAASPAACRNRKKANTMKTMTVTHRQLTSLLPAFHQAGLVPFIMGPAGGGKSASIQQYAASIKLPLVDTRLPYKAPTDIVGIPYFNEGKMRYAQPEEYPTQQCVWVLEEFASSPRQVQVAALQLLLDRRVGEYRVPAGTLLVATGNRFIDKCHVEKMSSAVINRLVLLELETSVPDWNQWAVKAGIHGDVYAYIQACPAGLHEFNGKTWDGVSAFPSPRSWEMVSRFLKTNPPSELNLHVISGIIGYARAVEFNAFLKLRDKVVTFEQVVADPTGSTIPFKLDERYAVASMLAMRVCPSTIGPVLAYLDRMPAEFRLMSLKLAAKRDAKVVSTKEFGRWYTVNQGMWNA